MKGRLSNTERERWIDWSWESDLPSLWFTHQRAHFLSFFPGRAAGSWSAGTGSCVSMWCLSSRHWLKLYTTMLGPYLLLSKLPCFQNLDQFNVISVWKCGDRKGQSCLPLVSSSDAWSSKGCWQPGAGLPHGAQWAESSSLLSEGVPQQEARVEGMGGCFPSGGSTLRLNAHPFSFFIACNLVCSCFQYNLNICS